MKCPYCQEDIEDVEVEDLDFPFLGNYKCKICLNEFSLRFDFKNFIYNLDFYIFILFLIVIFIDKKLQESIILIWLNASYVLQSIYFLIIGLIIIQLYKLIFDSFRIHAMKKVVSERVKIWVKIITYLIAGICFIYYIYLLFILFYEHRIRYFLSMALILLYLTIYSIYCHKKFKKSKNRHN